ncbi:YcbK family protein [Pandoraea communis]|uniref:YcbK family protein n=1 Tax=Pandoraea communis TaxID=2508297 RepID=UPI0025A66457|nr:DUF882 domain-containing protein [Pandoraea communis]MDM8356515.1 DUF882 domain-containing protein [Pandoraea communis]
MITRRQFLTAFAASGALLVPPIAHAIDPAFWTRDRQLWIRRDRPGRAREEFRVIYWTNGQYDYNNYIRLCYLFRDSLTEDVAAINGRLLDLLYGMQRWTELEAEVLLPIDLLSGFRTTSHNRRLENAASNSEHPRGNAADIRFPSVAPSITARRAKYFQMGGVGIYPSFTHVDVGRVREFVGKLPKQTSK